MINISAQQNTTSEAPLKLSVPDLHIYSPQTGIGRVFHSLRSKWGDKVQMKEARFQHLNLPLFRNFPHGVTLVNDTQIVFLPRMTGAQALRNTGRRPSVAVVHDIGVVDFPGDRKGVDTVTRYTMLKNFYGLRHASAIVTDSQFTAQRLTQYLPEISQRMTVVHAGVSDEFLLYTRTHAEARLRVENAVGAALRAPLLLYVGSELPRKNIALLFSVFNHIRRQHPDVQLLKIGASGHTRCRIQTMALLKSLKLVAGRDVLFLEHIDDSLLADAYRVADVFVSASLYEGFGLPALEALAVGTPVVVTNRGSFPEIVGSAGWAVEPTVEAFETAVYRALDSYSEKQRSARRYMAEQFTWSKAADQYIKVFQKVLDTN